MKMMSLVGQRDGGERAVVVIPCSVAPHLFEDIMPLLQNIAKEHIKVGID